jgi:mitochondrial fission protein ELM1
MFRILTIVDDKPGHQSVSRGVLSAFEKLGPVESCTLEVKLRSKIHLLVLSIMLNAGFRTSARNLRWLRVFYQFDHLPSPDFDFIVSAGGKTGGINAWLAKSWNLPNIYCASLRRFEGSLFSAVLSINPDFKHSGLIFSELAPCNFTGSGSGDAFLAERGLQRPEKIWTVLLGGDGSGYRYSGADVTEWIEGICVAARKSGAQLLLTTSRRTGAKHEQLIEELISQYPDLILYSVFYGKAPEKVMADYLDLADLVFVGEESSSMISEAVASQKPVFAVYAGTPDPGPEYQAFLKNLKRKHRIYSLPIHQLAAFDVEVHMASFRLLEQHPVDSIAAQIETIFELK